MLVVVHVDDFLASGKAVDVEWLGGELANTFDFSKVILGNTSLDKHEAKYLNWIIRWTTGNKVECEADPRHAEILLREWGLDQCRPNTVPMTKAMVDQLADGEVLSEGEAKRVRREDRQNQLHVVRSA